MSVAKDDYQNVRLKKILLEAYKLIADKTNQNQTVLISMCLEDCLEAARTRSPIMPRVARLLAAMEKDVVVADPKTFLFMPSDQKPGGRIRDDGGQELSPPEATEPKAEDTPT